MRKLFPIALLPLFASAALAQLNVTEPHDFPLTNITANAPNIYQGIHLDQFGNPITGGGGGGSASNAPGVVNVASFGALPSAGTLDCTLAISNAMRAQFTNHWPLYFPGCPSNTYYKISGPLPAYDYLNWLSGVNVVYFDTSGACKIYGGFGAKIIQTANYPIFTFTNGFNGIVINGLDMRYSPGPLLTGPYGVMLRANAAGSHNGNDCIIENCSFGGWMAGIYSESQCQFTLSHDNFSLNVMPAILVNTNNSTTVATGNNTVRITGCEWVGNWNGFYLSTGYGIVFDGNEVGGSQTNYLTISGAADVTIRGGNTELWYGALVNCINTAGNASPINVLEDNAGLLDFHTSGLGGPIWNVFSTNVNFGPRIKIVGNQGAVGIPSWDCSYQENFSVPQGSTLVQGSNSASGAFTNYMSTRSATAADGVNYNGLAPQASWEGTWNERYGYDTKGRTYLSFGAVSNFGPAQLTYNRNVLQYNYDSEDFGIPFLRVSNYWPLPQNFAQGANIYATAAYPQSAYIVSDGVHGLWTSHTFNDPGYSGAAWITANFAQDEFGFYVPTARGVEPIGSTARPVWYYDTLNNRTSIGSQWVNNKPGGTNTLTVYGQNIGITNRGVNFRIEVRTTTPTVGDLFNTNGAILWYSNSTSPQGGLMYLTQSTNGSAVTTTKIGL